MLTTFVSLTRKLVGLHHVHIPYKSSGEHHLGPWLQLHKEPAGGSGPLGLLSVYPSILYQPQLNPVQGCRALMPIPVVISQAAGVHLGQVTGPSQFSVFTVY